MAPGQPAARTRRPEQRERYLIPGTRGDRRDAVAISEAGAGSDFSAADDHRDARRQRRLRHQRREVVRHRRRRRRLSASCSRMCSPSTRPTMFLVDVDTPGVRDHARSRATRTPSSTSIPSSPSRTCDVGPEAVLGEVGAGLRTDPRLVHRGAADDRRPHHRCRRARPDARCRLGQAARAGRRAVDRPAVDPGHDRRLRRRHRHQPGPAPTRSRGSSIRPTPAMPTSERRCTPRRPWSSSPPRRRPNRVVDRAVQIFGGRGYIRDYPVERLWRELRVDRIWEGTSEIQRLVIANETDKRASRSCCRSVASTHRGRHCRGPARDDDVRHHRLLRRLGVGV